ncbi:hypothetical protein QNH39_26345 [Neobacillus novalis]|uniref:Uncharacterized protein n=1 Tax=Neobacillus novalis TaxID=220687 RepID=A0AA95SGG4_9BACI|nr:hypothetical protein [Neobacillus novalis]WHY86051.1 hypothetical protein QNH39_26345 [Neobacillus novalis]
MSHFNGNIHFIVYFTHTNNLTTEYYMKGKSADYLVNRLKWYYKGIITTNKWGIKADYLLSVFVREINPYDFLNLSKRDFAIINENKSYSLSDF